ncbi:methyltransferase domain-containing protein [Pseudomonas sp. NPDC089401]|uniref:methyltransferase domain-containing protein n=1 Tax=Pseudomonas sp. NPDC089401 TaxID=3364462 RepID=UPI00381A75F1
MSHHPSADQIISLYDRHAAAWNDLRANHFIDRKWIERFRSLLPRSATVLDLGCGSGQPVARYLIDAGVSVVGVDSSAQMLALCKCAISSAGMDSRRHAHIGARSTVRRHSGMEQFFPSQT